MCAPAERRTIGAGLASIHHVAFVEAILLARLVSTSVIEPGKLARLRLLDSPVLAGLKIEPG